MESIRNILCTKSKIIEALVQHINEFHRTEESNSWCVTAAAHPTRSTGLTQTILPLWLLLLVVVSSQSRIHHPSFLSYWFCCYCISAIPIESVWWIAIHDNHFMHRWLFLMYCKCETFLALFPENHFSSDVRERGRELTNADPSLSGSNECCFCSVCLLNVVFF